MTPIEKLKIYAEELLAESSLPWSEVKTRYGTSFIFPRRIISPQQVKISFNEKSITISEDSANNVWRAFDTIKEFGSPVENCRIIRGLFESIDAQQVTRATSRYLERVSEARKGGDVVVAVSGVADTQQNVASEPTAPYSNAKVSAAPPIKKVTIPVADQVALRIMQMVQVSGIPFVVLQEGVYTTDYVFECIRIRVTRSNMTVSANRRVVGNFESGSAIEQATWFGITLTNKNGPLITAILKDVFVLCEEFVRLRAMPMFSIPQVGFVVTTNHNFITAHLKDSKQARWSALEIGIGIIYKLDGYNCDDSGYIRVYDSTYKAVSLRSKKGLPSVEKLCEKVHVKKRDSMYSTRIYDKENPFTLMLFRYTVETRTPQSAELAGFGIRVDGDVINVEHHVVRVPNRNVPKKDAPNA